MTAYITATAYKAWADARGYTYGTDAEIEDAAMLATDFIDANYRFKGTLSKTTGNYRPPRLALPTSRKAAAQATYLQLLGRLTVDLNKELTTADVSESKQIGSLSKSTSYAERARYTTTYPTTSVDRLLKGFVVGGGLGGVVRC